MLVFALTNDYKKGIIASLNLFDLFESLLIILISCNSLLYGCIVDFIKTEIMINPKSIWIAIISENSQSGVIKLI